TVPDAAPHHLRRRRALSCVPAGAGDAVRGLRRRADLATAGAGHPVRRLRTLAAADPAGRRTVDPPADLLAAAPRRSDAVAAADGSSARGRALVPGRHGAPRALGVHHGSAEAARGP